MHPSSQQSDLALSHPREAGSVAPTYSRGETRLETCTLVTGPGPGSGLHRRPGRSARSAGGAPSPQGRTELGAGGRSVSQQPQPGAHTRPRPELGLWARGRQCLACLAARVRHMARPCRRNLGRRDHHAPASRPPPATEGTGTSRDPNRPSLEAAHIYASGWGHLP